MTFVLPTSVNQYLGGRERRGGERERESKREREREREREGGGRGGGGRERERKGEREREGGGGERWLKVEEAAERVEDGGTST